MPLKLLLFASGVVAVSYVLERRHEPYTNTQISPKRAKSFLF
jgi:hypothetical protein